MAHIHCRSQTQVRTWIWIPNPMATLQWQIQDFPKGGGAIPLNLGRKPIIWPDFHHKLHENERNWTERGVCF